MKYLSIILIVLASCAKGKLTTPPVTPQKHWYYDLQVYQDQSTRYQIQRYNGASWDSLLEVPDTSKSGSYHIALPIRDSDLIRAAAIQGSTVVYFPELRAIQ